MGAMAFHTIQPDFIEVDGHNCRLTDLDPQSLKRHKAVIVKNLQIVDDREFISFAAQFGPILPYRDGPIYSFFGEALDENELHYDGISASHEKKIPHWLVFRVQQASPAGNGGAFKISDSQRALEFLPPDLVRFLRSSRLKFFGYHAGQASDEFSFAIPAIRRFGDIESLRAYLPSIEERDIADSTKVFEGLTARESLDVFNLLRGALYHEEVIHRINFADNDVLVLNNRLAFHGRERFTNPVHRKLDRIQLLDEDAKQFALAPAA